MAEPRLSQGTAAGLPVAGYRSAVEAHRPARYGVSNQVAAGAAGAQAARAAAAARPKRNRHG